jgi:hypothetical protein
MPDRISYSRIDSIREFDNGEELSEVVEIGIIHQRSLKRDKGEAHRQPKAVATQIATELCPFSHHKKKAPAIDGQGQLAEQHRVRSALVDLVVTSGGTGDALYP